MRTNGSKKNYNAPKKRHWRRTIWNEVLCRTNGREKTEPILYLAGPDDLDRQIAVSKGVPEQNLIAIDWDANNAEMVRSQKKPSLCADALDALWAWPETRPVCAVLLDLCSGIEFGNLGIYDAFQCKALRNAVVMVNFQRGRDPWSNSLRETLIDMDAWKHQTTVEDTKNRAYQFLLIHALEAVGLAFGFTSGHEEKNGKPGFLIKYPSPGTTGHRRYMVAVSAFIGSMEPKFLSYRSVSESGSVLVFDSVVFWPSYGTLNHRNFPEFILNAAEKEIREIRRENVLASVSRKIAAMLAIRTMRLRKMA